MLDEASDAKVAVHLHRRPHLPQADSDATLTVAASDRGPDVGEVAAVAHLHLLQDVHPPGYTGLPPSAGRGYYAPPPPMQQPPPLLEPHEMIRKLECVLFLWFRCGRRSHQPDVPPVFKKAGPQLLLHPSECTTVRQRGVRVQHEEPPQNDFTPDVTVRGDG